MNIGGRIVKRLTELKWERKDLLDRVPDLTSQALYNLIKRDSVRSEWDEKIAEALGVSVMWLVYGSENEYVTNTNSKELTVSEGSGGNIKEFSVPETMHPMVAEVVRLMNLTDEAGKGMMLLRVRDIAKERSAISIKP